MVKPKPEEIAELLKKQELDTDGSESASGTNPVPGEDDTADVDTMISEVIGNTPDDDEPFNIGDEVNHDEKTIRDKAIDDYEEDDEENSDMSIERKENVSEDPQNDPYDSYGEDDDTDTEE